MIPNVEEHYRNDRKKFKTRLNKKKNSVQKQSIIERNSVLNN